MVVQIIIGTVYLLLHRCAGTWYMVQTDEKQLERPYIHLNSRGGHSHRRRVQSCNRGQDAVKRSRHFLGVGQTVKQCAGALSTALLAIKRRGRSFCACAINRWSRVKGKYPAWSSGPFFDGQKS